MNYALKFTLLSVLSLSIASCDDKFDINKLHEDPQLLVYCFPTEGDSTVIAVFRTVPVDTDDPDLDKLAKKVVDADITYKVNGLEFPVKRITDEDAVRLSIDTDNPANGLVGQYCAIAPQKVGDYISVEVRAKGLPVASGATYIPGKVEARIDTVVKDIPSSNGDVALDRMNATFSDNGSTEDYYMVRIVNRRMVGMAVGHEKDAPDSYGGFHALSYASYLEHKDEFPYWDFSQLQWRQHYVTVDTSSDPVFKNGSQLDDDFGFGYYDYADMIYFFNDQLFNGQTYTLRLDIFKNLLYIGNHYHWDLWDEYAGGYDYTLQFCKLSKEYYRYVKSKSDGESNDWVDNGFMPVALTYTNVHDGLGIVAGYAVSAPTYWVEVKE